MRSIRRDGNSRSCPAVVFMWAVEWTSDSTVRSALAFGGCTKASTWTTRRTGMMLRETCSSITSRSKRISSFISSRGHDWPVDTRRRIEPKAADSGAASQSRVWSYRNSLDSRGAHLYRETRIRWLFESPCEDGGTGRHARLRSLWSLRPWGFESPSPHRSRRCVADRSELPKAGGVRGVGMRMVRVMLADATGGSGGVCSSALRL